MTLGADRRKVILLGGLAVLAAYLLYSNFSADEPPPRAPRTQPIASAAKANGLAAKLPVVRPRMARSANREFRPSLKPRPDEEALDPMKIDPTLRLDLLAKLKNVQADRVERSLFDFSAEPPKEPEPKIVPKDVAQAKAEAEAPKIPEDLPKPVKPPPPPINLKFYGFISPADAPVKRAFFLDGEEIFVAGEGDVIRKKYKIVRIGVNSAVVEDTEHQHQQTLALVEQKI